MGKSKRLLMSVVILLILIALEFLIVPALKQNGQNTTNKIMAENQKQGTTAWRTPNFGKYLQNFKDEDDDAHPAGQKPSYADHGSSSAGKLLGSNLLIPNQWTSGQAIEGYASKASINIGESIDFKVSTTASTFNLTVYRMGWYGGDGGRWYAEADNLPGHLYAVPAPDPVTGMVAANWPTAYTLQTTTAWVTGYYMVWLQPNNGGAVQYIPFIVRDDSSHADILYQVALTTYQAYNAWGGKSLYEYNSPTGRASKVSFDRPYDHDDGSGMYYSGDYDMIMWMEKQGYNIAYATSIDMENNPALLANHKMFLSVWHDEYWSKNMRDHLVAARDAGKHLAFFDSNNIGSCRKQVQREVD